MDIADDWAEPDGPDWAARLYFAFAGLVALLMLAGIGYLGFLYYQKITMTPARLEAQMLTQPDQAHLARAFRRYYPKDFEGFLDQTAASIRNGGDASTVGDAAHARMQAFVRSKVEAIARAPSVELIGLARANHDFVSALRWEDTSLCAQYGNGSLSPQTKLPAPLAEKLGVTVEQTLRAARAGEDHPVSRPAQIQPQDGQAFLAALHKVGASDFLIRQMTSGQGAANAYATEQCDWTVYTFAAAKSLPPDQGARVMAVILRGSGKSRYI